jgi:hypothetical protein
MRGPQHPVLHIAIVAASLRILGGQAVQAQRLVEAWKGDPEIAALTDQILLQPAKNGRRTIGATLMQLIFHSNHRGWETVWGDRRFGR